MHPSVFLSVPLHPQVEGKFYFHVQDELHMNNCQDFLGKINISSIQNKPSDSNSGVDPHLEFSLGLSSSGNFSMIFFLSFSFLNLTFS